MKNQSVDWSSLWFEQNKIFFDTAKKYLATYFVDSSFDIYQHEQQIQLWLHALKEQMSTLFSQSETTTDAWKNLQIIFIEAGQLLMERLKNGKATNSMMNFNELYLLWLNCCQEVYEKKLATKQYQAMFGNYLTEVLKFWNKN